MNVLKKKTLKIDIIKMNSIKINDVKEIKDSLRVSVLFETEQIKVLKDKGKIIDGDQDNSILVKDLGFLKKKYSQKI